MNRDLAYTTKYNKNAVPPMEVSLSLTAKISKEMQRKEQAGMYLVSEDFVIIKKRAGQQ